VHLRFDIGASSIPDELKTALRALGDRRISKEGVVVIKAQSHRSQEKNRLDAVQRLLDLIRRAAKTPAVRRPTRPTRASQRRRMQRKIRHSEIKGLRGKVQSLAKPSL